MGKMPRSPTSHLSVHEREVPPQERVQQAGVAVLGVIVDVAEVEVGVLARQAAHLGPVGAGGGQRVVHAHTERRERGPDVKHVVSEEEWKRITQIA